MSELATTEKRSLVADMAAAHGLEPAKFYATVQEMCGCQNARPEHFAGLLLVAKQLGLNPITRQLYLMPTKKGVQVVVPVDGYLTILNRHPRLVSHTCEAGSDEIGGNYAEVTIYTREQLAAKTPPFKHREYMDECKGTTGPWRSHPLRMLKHKAYSQAVRYCFGVYAMDEDEWHRAGMADEGVEPSPDVTPAVPLDALVSDAGSGDGAVAVDQSGASPGSGTLSTSPPPAFDAEESARLDAEIAEGER